MKIHAQINFPDPTRLVGELAKQTRFALKTALNTTATRVRDGLRCEIQGTIDRPTPYTLNSLFIRAATSKKLEATVWLKDERATSNAGTPATRYMLPHIQGGQRTLKRFERALQITGQMPKGWYAVPGAGARLDAFGNMNSGQIIQILSQLRVTLTSGFTRNMSWDARSKIAAQRRAGGRFFVVMPGAITTHGGLRPGVYQREFMGRQVTPVLIYVTAANYRKRLSFEAVGQRIADTHLLNNYRQAHAQALATAP
jgi:YD repeat-containing protein